MCGIVEPTTRERGQTNTIKHIKMNSPIMKVKTRWAILYHFISSHVLSLKMTTKNLHWFTKHLNPLTNFPSPKTFTSHMANTTSMPPSLVGQVTLLCSWYGANPWKRAVARMQRGSSFMHNASFEPNTYIYLYVYL